MTDAAFPSQRLVVEITEYALIADAENAKRTVGVVKSRGIKISLDDFGTVYSSLHHLRLLPFDKIKIDQSFVRAVETDGEALKIVGAIVGLAASLGLPVVAEGVESESVALKLEQLGCTQGQRFHLGHPLSGSAVPEMLRGFSTRVWRTRLASRFKAAAA